MLTAGEEWVVGLVASVVGIELELDLASAGRGNGDGQNGSEKNEGGLGDLHGFK